MFSKGKRKWLCSVGSGLDASHQFIDAVCIEVEYVASWESLVIIIIISMVSVDLYFSSNY